jgi:predicted pyridoxine 5'-phosphate oxidase superfamily flavin-nucleotide-binding protein
MTLDAYKNQQIESEIQLRKIIPAHAKILDKRIQTELDRYCLELISFSTIIISAFSQSTIPMMPLSKDQIIVINHNTITLCIDNEIAEGGFASLYFLVPGVGHGLRVSGQVQQHQEGKVVLKVESAYLHCARAAARAELWGNVQTMPQFEKNQFMSPKQFLSASPYLFIKTMNKMGETELSPRGDHDGFVHLIDDKRLFIPERPGNKVAVSLRNILKNNKVELLFFIPGTNYVMHVNGYAILTKDNQLLDLSVVKNKRPKLGVLLEQCRFSIEQNISIEQAQPWFGEKQVKPDRLTRFSTALSAHMNGEGLIGKATTPFIDAVVKNDMKNLY